jgi:hypothetical protein
MHSPTHRQASAPLTNIQSTFHTSPNLCENVPCALLFGNSGKSHTICTQQGTCIYTHILHNTGAGQAEEIKIAETAVNGTCQGNLSVCRKFASCGIRSLFYLPNTGCHFLFTHIPYLCSSLSWCTHLWLNWLYSHNKPADRKWQLSVGR